MLSEKKYTKNTVMPNGILSLNAQNSSCSPATSSSVTTKQQTPKSNLNTSNSINNDFHNLNLNPHHHHHHHHHHYHHNHQNHHHQQITRNLNNFNSINNSNLNSSNSTTSSTSSTGSVNVKFTGCFLKDKIDEREKYLTAKYPNHQMALIKKRLKVEFWIDEQLKYLFDIDEDNTKDDYDICADDLVDTLLDMDLDGERREYIMSQVNKAKRSRDEIQTFVDQLLVKLRML